MGAPWTPAGLLLRPGGLYSPVLVQSSLPDGKWAIWLRLKAAVWHLLEPLGIGPQPCEGRGLGGQAVAPLSLWQLWECQ